MAAEFGHHKDRTPTHGYAATREAAMAAFVKSLAAGVGQYIQGFLRRLSVVGDFETGCGLI